MLTWKGYWLIHLFQTDNAGLDSAHMVAKEFADLVTDHFDGLENSQEAFVAVVEVWIFQSKSKELNTFKDDFLLKQND